MTCRRVSEYLSKSLDEPLSPSRRARLSFHKILCRNCRRFGAQLVQIDDAVEEYLSSTDTRIQLSSQAKEQIATEIRNSE